MRTDLGFLNNPNDQRMYYIFEAFFRDISVKEVYKHTKINTWFLSLN